MSKLYKIKWTLSNIHLWNRQLTSSCIYDFVQQQCKIHYYAKLFSQIVSVLSIYRLTLFWYIENIIWCLKDCLCLKTTLSGMFFIQEIKMLFNLFWQSKTIEKCGIFSIIRDFFFFFFAKENTIEIICRCISRFVFKN